MKRRRPSSPCLNNESEGVVYAVFNVFGSDDVGYAIYKLNSVTEKEKEKDDDDDVHVHKLGKPFATLKSSIYPACMSFFSVGSKLYFCGGLSVDHSILYPFPTYESKAYMLDINSKSIVSIPPMNSPKPVPFVFGPVDNRKFYIFSVSRHELEFGFPTFEMLDTLTNEWKCIHVPPSVGQQRYHGNPALCGSKILISGWFDRINVFCTKSETWRTISDTNIPFTHSHPLYLPNKFGHILLSYREILGGKVYLCKDEDNGVDAVGPFECVSWLNRLKKRLDSMDDMPRRFLGSWGVMFDFFPFQFNHGNSICVARSAQTDVTRGTRLVIDIFHVSYSWKEGGTKLKLKVKVNNALRYNYRSKLCMDPTHIFVV